MDYTSCFIIGHRPQRFKFKYNEGYKLCIKMKKVLESEIIRQYTENKVRHFWVSGAIGVSCWAAEIILELKKQRAYHDMELMVALPFPGFNEKFDTKQKARWRDILKECTDSVTICESYSVNAYQRCNYYMVDRSSMALPSMTTTGVFAAVQVLQFNTQCVQMTREKKACKCALSTLTMAR